MEVQNKLNIKIYSLMLVFFIYSISIIFKNDLWGNILSPVVAFLSSYIIWGEIKKINKHKWNWITLLLVVFSWGFSDFVWLIMEEVLLLDPSKFPIIDYIYLLCNIFIVSCCVIYFYYNLKKWNTVLLFMDIIVIGSIVMISALMIMFSNLNITSFLTAEYICNFMFLFLDLLSISTIIIMIFYSKSKAASRSEIIVVTSIVIYVLCDLYYVYLIFSDKYDANTWIDLFFMIPMVLLAFAAINEVKYPTPVRMVKKNSIPENYNKSKIFKWLLVVPLFLYFLRNDDITNIIHMAILLIVYIFIRGYIQISIKNEYYLKREKSLNDILDQTVKKKTEQLIETNKVLVDMSKLDALTGLYSRRYFIEYIDLLISNSSQKTFALFFMDLDRFKSINDTHGHEMGDYILKKIAKRLQSWCPDNVKLARTGGDEFSVLVEGDVSEEILVKYAKEIIKLCEKTILKEPYSLRVGISIGIALYPIHASERDTLMKYADIAMYELKKNYLSERFNFFDNELSEKIQRKHKLELLLQDADFNNEFELYFQPQYRLTDDTLVGMEALIRWKCKGEGFISPAEFIPIAEETSLIIKIGEWVFDEAIKKIKYFNDKYNSNLRIGINISPKQIDQKDFVKWLIDNITSSGVNTEWIELEITENSAMTSELSMEDIFCRLGKYHISTAIDDFGTGYSSLSYIKRFHIDRIKIAKELIDNIASDNNTLLIVKAIIMMTKGMGLKTIAEGVEYEEQLNILKELECDEIQGYFYGRPVPADVFEKEHILKSKK